MVYKQYTIGLRKRINKDRFFEQADFLFEEVKINTHGKYWLADPFLFEKNGITYLFYEAFDLLVQRGYIGYSVIKADGKASDPKIILKCKIHRSFPFIFEKNNDVYIIPESCGDYNVRLYKATEFPDKWKEDKVLVSDIFGVDSILFDFNQKEYLLTSQQYMYPPQNKVISCWVKNRLYELDNLSVSNPDGVIVSEGDRGVRNAGAVFNYDNKKIRPGQYSVGGVYGKGLSFFEIEDIAPYKEKIIYEITSDDMQQHVKLNNRDIKLVGVHTYNSSNHYEVIDLSYYDNLAFRTIVYKKSYSIMRHCYHAMKKTVNFTAFCFNKVMKKFVFGTDENIYQSVIGKNAPWVFVSYITDAFYHQNDENFLNKHQNKREALAMAKVFNKLGYNAYFMLYTSEKELPDIDCRLIFGHEPGIQRAKAKYKNAKIIFYAVSTYYVYRNSKIKQMTDDFNIRFKADIPYRRLVTPHTSLVESDLTLLIGSEVTKKTYPVQYQDRIFKIHQSTQACKYLKNIEATGSKEFLYLASTGNILKGVQAIIDFFSRHQEYTVHWVGPIENDVEEAIKNFMTSNIKTYGFQNISSQLVLGLMERCDFLIYPSGVEGVPGGVLNAMKNGLIPLVTPWASFDGIESCGFVMKDADEIGIESAIHWAMNLSKEEINERKKYCQNFVLENYNINQFTKEFEDFMRKSIASFDRENTNN